MADPADIIADAADTLDRLRDLKPREVSIHVPGPLERWRADAEASERAREQAQRELRRSEREMADAVEERQAEQEADELERFEAYLQERLARERTALLEALADEFSAAVGKLRAEFEEQISEVRKQVERERTGRRHTRDATHERIQGMTQSHDREVAVLKERITSLQREVDSLRAQRASATSKPRRTTKRSRALPR